MVEEKDEQEKEETSEEAPKEAAASAKPKEKLSEINIDSTNQYIRKISQIDHKISREESHELWKRVKRGDRRAKERIMELNLSWSSRSPSASCTRAPT